MTTDPNLNFLFSFTIQADQEFLFEIFLNNNLILTEVYPLDKYQLSSFDLWLARCGKVVTDHNDFKDISVNFLVKSAIPEVILSSIKSFAFFLTNTQSLIKKYEHLLSQTTSFDGHFFYNVDDLNTFKQLHQEVEKSGKLRSIYANSLSGWNKEKRIWGEGSYLNLESLVQHILSHRISHVYSVNSYYLSHLMQSDGFLPLPFFKALKIEYIIIDYDSYDLNPVGFLQKNVMNEKSFRRFSIVPHVTRYFDENYQNINVRYFMLGAIDKQPNYSNLQPISDIAIISQARLKDVVLELPQTLFFFEHISAEEPFLDYQNLYFTLIYLLKKDQKLPLKGKEKFYSSFSRLSVNVLSLLKYEIIDALNKANLKPKVYGDAFWGHLFPENYQNKFLSEDEIKELFQNKNTLYLLLNQNYSYLENNPVFLRALNLSAPYLCFPTVISSSDLSGLQMTEYRNTSELIRKIPETHNILKNNEYNKSLAKLIETTSNCEADFLNMISGTQAGPGLFNSLTLQYDHFLANKLEAYLKKNHQKVFHLYDNLTQDFASKYDPNKSSLCMKSYFSVIHQTHLQLIHQK